MGVKKVDVGNGCAAGVLSTAEAAGAGCGLGDSGRTGKTTSHPWPTHPPPPPLLTQPAPHPPSAAPGGGLAERGTLPGLNLSKVTRTQKPRPYRVLLHNDDVNKREYVVKVLLKVVDGLTMEDALSIMQEAHAHGRATVVSCAQEDAERYCEGLRGAGLIASIEPAGSDGAA